MTQSDVYDALGRSVHTTSPEAGETWLLADVSGQPIRTWKTGDITIRQTYDVLRRPVGLYVTEGLASERLHVFTVYGDFLAASSDTDDNDLADDNSLKGRVWRQYDGAGLVETTAYDFKGNVLGTKRTFLDDVDTEIDWSALTSDATAGGLDTTAASDLLTESFTTTTTYDALNRPVTMTTPDDSVTRNAYNLAGLLEAVDVQVRGDSTWTQMVRELDYNARGQRTRIVYASNADDTDGAVTTAYTYDPETFRLMRLRSLRFSDGKRLQDLTYTYDACGNIVQISDDAQQTLFFDNSVVSPTAKYQYDSLYRLVSAEGREKDTGSTQVGYGDPTVGDLPHNNSGTMRTYYESYVYDGVGNITEMKHQGGTEASPGTVHWQRWYQYATDSNKLLSTSLPGDTQGSTPYTDDDYTYNGRGALTELPHLDGLTRQFDDQIRAVDINGSDDAVYHYDAAGQRVRKVVRLGANVEERLYLGAWERYRKTVSSTLDTERETLHVMDDQRRVVMVETLTVDNGSDVTTPTPRQRFQLDNHLGSSSLEVDEDGDLISYEEYHPYGTTSWWAEASTIQVSRKRYRYTGKEKDEETGLCYHGARYYLPWLGRWEKADPAGMVDGPNRFAYVRGNPVGASDPTGLGTVEDQRVTEIEFTDPVLITDDPSTSPEAERLRAAQSEDVTPTTNRTLLDQPSQFVGVGPVEPTPTGPAERVPALALLYIEPGTGPLGSTGPGLPQQLRDWQDENLASVPVGSDYRNLYIATTGWNTAGRPMTEREQEQAEAKAWEAALVSGLTPVGTLARGGRIRVGNSGLPGVTTTRASQGGAKFALAKHGTHPSPRPTGTQSHHGVMSAWMKKHYAGYDPMEAPAILMPTPNHQATFGVYNRWRAQMKQSMGGTFDWGKVSESQMRQLSEDMFDAAGVPTQMRADYWQWFDRMKAALE